MLEKWIIDVTFKKLFEQNIKNRNSNYGELGLSFNIEGLVPISKHKRKHVSKSLPIYMHFSLSIYVS